MITEHGLNNFRDFAAKAFEAGTAAFPYYTLHGQAHLLELDRLATLLCRHIPFFDAREDQVRLLRLAVIMHDYAMVELPGKPREDELLTLMRPGQSFADVLRETHQDEIRRVFSRPEFTSRLSAWFPGGGYLLQDASIIASYHRYHPLSGARDDLKGLCALMRLVDELDIGPRRAPAAAYDAKRNRMDPKAKFHWLKHIFTRPFEENSTFTVETIEGAKRRRILRLWVSVLATADTWKPFRDSIVRKLNDSLNVDGIAGILKDNYNVEIAFVPDDGKSGEFLFLQPSLKEDAQALLLTDVFDGSNDSARGGDAPAPAPTPAAPIPAPLPIALPPSAAHPVTEPEAACETGGLEGHGPSDKGRDGVPPLFRVIPSTSTFDREFILHTLPPEELPSFLCRSGRLSVIGNVYIPGMLRTIGGSAGAPHRLFVGPADCGKTRAAAEWVGELTRARPSEWVVLRTDIGAIPDRIDRIVLDRSRFAFTNRALPQKALLFIDDLPHHLPAASPDTLRDSLSLLLEWFESQPYFREKRLLGTIRNEDMRAAPDWPAILPSLREPVELIAVSPPVPEAYRHLWEGMRSGTVCGFVTEGESTFSLTMTTGFLSAVTRRPADPEAVATFMRECARKGETELNEEDATRFHESAVNTWLSETWPAIEKKHGLYARIFYTIARFLAAGLRPESGFRGTLVPSWEYHKILGEALCALHGVDPCEMEQHLNSIGREGHAVGKKKSWIRPIWDYILQSEKLSHIELPLSDPHWFTRVSKGLSDAGRHDLAMYLSSSGAEISLDDMIDVHWSMGIGDGSLILARHEKNQELKSKHLFNAIKAYLNVVKSDTKNSRVWTCIGFCYGEAADSECYAKRKQSLLNESIAAYQNAVLNDPKNSTAWNNLGVKLVKAVDSETKTEEKRSLREQANAAYRSAVSADPNSNLALTNLGVCLGQAADDEPDAGRKRALRNEAIATYRLAVSADPKNSAAMNNLGVKLGQAADDEPDDRKKHALREEMFAAFRGAISADPKNVKYWNNLGVSLGRAVDLEPDPDSKRKLLEKEIDAFHSAVKVDETNSQAWNSYGVSLGRAADAESDAVSKMKFHEKECAAFRKAVSLNPKLSQGWINLGICLNKTADAEPNVNNKKALREEAITAYRSAVSANPSDCNAWNNLSADLLRIWHLTHDAALLDEAYEAASHAASLGGSRYNLACILSLFGRIDEALGELAGCLARDEIGRDHVKCDHDWDNYRDDPRFLKVIEFGSEAGS